MSGFIAILLLATAMMAMIWVALGGLRSRIRVEERRLPGQLSASERRKLYQRLGIDPAAMARQRQSNVIWLDPRVIDRRRTDA
jgi:hypothetical protein